MAKETLLQATTNDSIQTLSGVTYFKLKPGYDGDVTKHCGLTGDEVDKNFYFLRGYDIDTITFIDNILTITRVNGEPFEFDLTGEDRWTTLDLNKDTGMIIVSYPDGTTVELGGFLLDIANATVATDETLTGDGRIISRLGISPVERTGEYAPVEKIIDIGGGDFMPDTRTCGIGYRVLTKEPINVYGKLYKYNAVESISQDLAESGWRIPSKDDWDEMLNAFECSGDSRNHSDDTDGVFGRQAGVALKSPGITDDGGLWNPSEPGYCGNNQSDMSIYPVGGVDARYINMDDPEHDIEGVGELGYYWTNTEIQGQIFIKIFAFNTGGVRQDIISKNGYAAIRLVKDYDGGAYNTFERILGDDYPVKLVTGIYEDYPYQKLWTKINLYSDINDNVDTELSGASQYVYCVCEWNGKEWVKKMMNDGDTVVVKGVKQDSKYVEYMLQNGDLVDIIGGPNSYSKSDMDNSVNSIYVRISAITDSITELQTQVSTNTNDIETLFSNLDELNGDLSDLANELSGLISSGNTDLTNLILEVSGNVITLTNTVESYNQQLENEISGISSDLEIAINNITQTINEFSDILGGKDIKAGTYILPGESSSEMVLLRENNNDDIKIKISDDFFDFGTISRN